MAEFCDRLRQWRESIGMTQKELAIQLGVSDQTVGRYERGLRSPDKDEFAKLVELGADIVWLVTGLRSVSMVQTQLANVRSDLMLPRYNAVLSAGSGFSEPDDETAESLAVPEEFVRRVLKRSPKGLVVAQSEGTSMMPTIQDRELLVIDTADTRLQNGRIYAISVDQQLFIKRIARTIKGTVLLVPDNKDFPTEELSGDFEVRIVGQVIWHGGSLE